MLTISKPNLSLTPFKPPQYFHIYHLLPSLYCMHMGVRLSTHWNLGNLLAVNSQEKCCPSSKSYHLLISFTVYWWGFMNWNVDCLNSM